MPLNLCLRSALLSVFMRVLVVESDSHILTGLTAALTDAGFTVTSARTGEEATVVLAAGAHDALLLSGELPDVGGLEMCRRVRRLPDRVRILMYSYAAQDPRERVRGLNAGADVYVAQPVSAAEILARLRALLRRDAPLETPVALTWCGVKLDPGLYAVVTDADWRELTPTEYRLLEVFMQHPGQVLSNPEIERSVWGAERPGSASLRVYIGYVRRKIRECGAGQLIHTVPKEGYVLRQG